VQMGTWRASRGSSPSTPITSGASSARAWHPGARPDGDPPLGLRIRELNGGTVVAAGFCQGGAANLRLGEEFDHNRLSLIASIGAWGAPDRHVPLWHRRRVMDTATRLLSTDRISVLGCSAAASRSTTPRRPTAGSTSTPRTPSRSPSLLSERLSEPQEMVPAEQGRSDLSGTARDRP
jgi:hypothetical protein